MNQTAKLSLLNEPCPFILDVAKEFVGRRRKSSQGGEEEGCTVEKKQAHGYTHPQPSSTNQTTQSCILYNKETNKRDKKKPSFYGSNCLSTVQKRERDKSTLMHVPSASRFVHLGQTRKSQRRWEGHGYRQKRMKKKRQANNNNCNNSCNNERLERSHPAMTNEAHGPIDSSEKATWLHNGTRIVGL